MQALFVSHIPIVRIREWRARLRARALTAARVDKETGMDRTTRNERIGLWAMGLTAAVSLLVAAYGHVGVALVIFFSAAIPLPMLAAIRARRTRDADAAAQDDAGR
jgi:hypothetical protein